VTQTKLLVKLLVTHDSNSLSHLVDSIWYLTSNTGQQQGINTGAFNSRNTGQQHSVHLVDTTVRAYEACVLRHAGAGQTF
jgi:hypothetical protein